MVVRLGDLRICILGIWFYSFFGDLFRWVYRSNGLVSYITRRLLLCALGMGFGNLVLATAVCRYGL